MSASRRTPSGLDLPAADHVAQRDDRKAGYLEYTTESQSEVRLVKAKRESQMHAVSLRRRRIGVLARVVVGVAADDPASGKP